MILIMIIKTTAKKKMQTTFCRRFGNCNYHHQYICNCWISIIFLLFWDTLSTLTKYFYSKEENTPNK